MDVADINVACPLSSSSLCYNAFNLHLFRTAIDICILYFSHNNVENNIKKLRATDTLCCARRYGGGYKIYACTYKNNHARMLQRLCRCDGVIR